MNRRSVLAAGTALLASGLAGCGFAHAAGAPRREETFPDPDTRRLLDRLEDGLVTGSSGMRWMGSPGDRDFTTGTAVRGIDRNGQRRWELTLEGETDALAADGSWVYLRRDERIVAVELGDSTSLDSEDITWEATVPDARGGIAGANGVAICAANGATVAIRDGEEVWHVDEPSATIVATDTGSIIAPPGRVLEVAHDGTERWTLPIPEEPALAYDEEIVVLTAGEKVVAIDRTPGERLWRESTAPGGTGPTIGTDSIVVSSGQGLERYDRSSGERAWRIPRGHRPDPVVVVRPSRVYAATADGQVLGIEAGEVEWTWALDRAGRPIDGWIDGDQVAFADENGTIRWYQRTDESIPLVL